MAFFVTKWRKSYLIFEIILVSQLILAFGILEKMRQSDNK